MKKAVALFLTDTHLSKNNTDIVYDIFEQAKKVADEYKIETIIHGGDFFDSRSGQPLQVLKTSRSIENLFKDYTVYIINGNHDKTDQNSDSGYCDFLHKFITVDLYQQHDLENGIVFSFLPFYKTEKYIELLKSIEVNKEVKNILITHPPIIKGARGIEGNLEPSLFTKFDLVLAGDIHDRQTIGNILYTGSTHQANFGENEYKGFTIIYNDGTTEFIQAEFPKYITTEISVNDLMDPDNRDSALYKISNYLKTDQVRVKIKGDSIKLKSIDTAILDDMGIKVIKESTETTEGIELAKSNEYVSFDDKSIFEEFEEYCNKNNLDKKEGINYLKKIL